MIAAHNGSQVGVYLYASSPSFSSTAGLDYKLDMEGLQFCDIPALNCTNPELK